MATMRSSEVSPGASAAVVPADSWAALAAWSSSASVEAVLDGGAASAAGGGAVAVSASTGVDFWPQPARAAAAAKASSSFFMSTHPLDVGSQIAAIFGRQPLGDGEHHRRVRAGLRATGGILVVAGAGGIVVQLLDRIDGVLRLHRGITRGRHAAPHRAVAGGAGRNAAFGIAVTVQRLAGGPVRGIGLQAIGRLHREVRGKIGYILVIEVLHHRLHQRRGPLAIADALDLVAGIGGVLSGDDRPVGRDAVAVDA